MPLSHHPGLVRKGSYPGPTPHQMNSIAGAGFSGSIFPTRPRLENHWVQEKEEQIIVPKPSLALTVSAYAALLRGKALHYRIY